FSGELASLGVRAVTTNTRAPLTSRMKSLVTQPPETTILSITILRNSVTDVPPNILLSSRGVRKTGFGRLNATIERFIWPGSFGATLLTAGFASLALTAVVLGTLTTGAVCRALTPLAGAAILTVLANAGALARVPLTHIG